MRVVIALGGNAMTSPDGSARPEDQIAAIHTAMAATADLIAAGHEVVVTHGNGPQVGNLLVKNELAAAVVPRSPWTGAAPRHRGRSASPSLTSWKVHSRNAVVRHWSPPSSAAPASTPTTRVSPIPASRSAATSAPRPPEP
jgi:hypothetical protein